MDGVFQEEVEDTVAEFTLKNFNPKVNVYKVVAIDDSRFRTQGFLESERDLKPAKRLRVQFRRFFRGKAIIQLRDKKAVFTWSAPGAKRPIGTTMGNDLVLEYPDREGPYTVEIWVHNAPEGKPKRYTFEFPQKKRK